MRIIIAPAKKMVVDTDSFAVDSLPQFLEQTEQLKAVLQGMSSKDLQALWKCNDSIAKLNIERLEQMNLRRNLTPTILSYEGGGRLPGPLSVLGQPPGPAAGFGDGFCAESGLQGVQQGGGDSPA